MKGALRIERYDPVDLDSIMSIELASFSAPWSRESYQELAPLESIDIWIIKDSDELIGYMLLQHVSNEMELHTLAIKPNRRRSGVARILLNYMIDEARRLNVSKIFLQVRPSNIPARSLYNSFGFKLIGIRRRYYQDNDEDALVMRLDVQMGETSEIGEILK